MYETTGIGYRIGNISVNSTACADDIPLISEEQNQTQILVNMTCDYAYMEGYELFCINVLFSTSRPLWPWNLPPSKL
jgi:hypothetical protein